MVSTLLADPVMRGLLKQAFVDELKPELSRMVQEAVEAAVQKHLASTSSSSALGSSGVAPLTASSKSDKDRDGKEKKEKKEKK
jgi:hypothetical protein